MPDENIKTTLEFAADITDFKSATQEATRAIKLANSEFAAVSSSMDDWSSSTDGLSAKLRQLSTVHQAEQRKLDVLKRAYDDVAREQGENSAAAQDLATKINNQQAKVNKAAKDISTYEEKLSELESTAGGAADDIKKAGDAAKDAGDEAKDSAGGWTIAKDVIADFISNVVQNAVDTLFSAAEATREYRREMAQLAQNAADSGHDVGVMKEALSGVASVTGDAEAAMEGINMLMATGLETDNLTYAAEALAGAATRFDGLNFESMAEGLQESLAVGEAVGPFAELIERTGGNLEAFNEGMGKCTTTAEKQQYVMKWLSDSGLKGVHDAYVQNNADLVEAEKAQLRHNEAMASIGAALEPVNTALTNIKAEIMERLAPVVTQIVQWVLDNLPTIAPIVTGIATALGVLAAALAIQGLISGVAKAFAFLNTTLLANPFVLIATLIAGIVAAIITLWNNCEAFRNAVTEIWGSITKAFTGAWNSIKKAWSGAGEWFGNIRKSINDKFDDIGNWFSKKFTQAKDGAQKAWSGMKNYFSNVKSNLTTTFSNVDSWMGSKFGDSWTAIKQRFASSTVAQYFRQIWNSVQGIFSAVKSVLSGNFSDAWASIKGVFSGWSSFFSGLWDKVKSAFANAPSAMAGIGGDIVRGLWNGISNLTSWIGNKIRGFCSNALGAIKNFFGIKSPSRLMRDEVGKMLGLGMVEGIESSRKNVAGAVQNLGNAAMSGLPSGAGHTPGAAVGGKTIIINQTNNSPKALSRLEIYRQTHNALAAAGGA